MTTVPEEDVDPGTKTKIDTSLTALRESDDFSTQESFNAFETIMKLSDDRSKRQVLGDYLAANGYPELYVSMMKWLQDRKPNEGDTERDGSELAIDGFWSFTDGSPLLCQQLGMKQNSVVDLIFQDLREIDVTTLSVDQMKEGTDKHHILAKLGILHNCIRLHSDNRELYRKANAVKILKNFVDSQEVPEYVKTVCLLILAYIVDEKESETLETNNINFLVSLLEKVLGAETQRYGGYTAFELLDGIYRLAMNDTNKAKTAQSRFLALVTTMMSEGRDKKEQLLAAKTVWRLSFAPANKKILQEDAALIKALGKLQTSPDAAVKQTSHGALWEIKRASVTTGIGHIMLSYQWDVQEKMKILKGLLEGHGYEVWMDIDKIGDNIMDGMADAVEKAVVVLVCVSEKYKNSENCRSEAIYARNRKRTIIPLMVQKGYHPDGWLGVLMDDKKYYRMHTEDLVHDNFASLMRALGSRGRKSE